MTDLIDQVKHSFEQARVEQTREGSDQEGIVFQTAVEEPAPGFVAMRAHYGERILVLTRRGYRHFAGASLPQDYDQLNELTTEVMLDGFVALLMQVFADGVMIGHRDHQVVKMMFHFDNVEHLFHDSVFREASDAMAAGFGSDVEVLTYFIDFFAGGLNHIAHTAGFTHGRVDSRKIWDVWLLVGTATTCSAYLAGHRLGNAWRERDVLAGIEIATEEAPGGVEGEA